MGLTQPVTEAHACPAVVRQVPGENQDRSFQDTGHAALAWLMEVYLCVDYSRLCFRQRCC